MTDRPGQPDARAGPVCCQVRRSQLRRRSTEHGVSQSDRRQSLLLLFLTEKSSTSSCSSGRTRHTIANPLSPMSLLPRHPDVHGDLDLQDRNLGLVSGFGKNLDFLPFLRSAATRRGQRGHLSSVPRCFTHATRRGLGSGRCTARGCGWGRGVNESQIGSESGRRPPFPGRRAQTAAPQTRERQNMVTTRHRGGHRRMGGSIQ